MTSLTRADPMHGITRDDDWSTDSGIGGCSNSSSCSNSDYSSHCSSIDGPTDFAAMNGGTVVSQKLNRKMATMYIGSGKQTIKSEEWKEIIDLDDECARDCDTAMSLMPPPAIPSYPRPASRRILGDISNSTINSPVSSKSFSRNATMHSTSASGLRARKRGNQSAACPSPFGSIGVGKRWRRAETIDEHSEMASTSYASIDRSSECSTVTFARPHTITRVQSSSVLEKGIYAHHRDEENVPGLLEVSYRLNTIEKSESHVYKRIEASTLAELIRTMGDGFEKSYTLIDCRYPYEFEGGHIQGAINVYDPALVDARFFTPSTSLLKGEDEGRQKIPIFYCEFSQKRGPSMALAVRAFDRIRNSLAYPHVDHAEMYVLDGGYRGFYNATNGFKDLCLPCGYIEMEEEKYKKEMDKFRHHKSRALLSFTSTVSRIPQHSTMEAKLARRAEQSANSPLGVARTTSRRALLFKDDDLTLISKLPNPQFS